MRTGLLNAPSYIGLQPTPARRIMIKGAAEAAS